MSLVFPIRPETKVYWYFQGVLKETNGMKWINQLSCFTLTFDGSAKFGKSFAPADDSNANTADKATTNIVTTTTTKG